MNAEFRSHPAWRYTCRHVPTGATFHRVFEDDVDRHAFLETLNRWNQQQPERWVYVAS